MLPLRILTAIIGVIVGGWMLFDGVHVMLRGKYFGPAQPGPWSTLFVRLGVDPFRLGPLFIVLGSLWILFLIAMLCGQSWGRWGAVAVAIASLWYLPVGTVLSVTYLGLIYFISTRTR